MRAFLKEAHFYWQLSYIRLVCLMRQHGQAVTSASLEICNQRQHSLSWETLQTGGLSWIIQAALDISTQAALPSCHLRLLPFISGEPEMPLHLGLPLILFPAGQNPHALGDPVPGVWEAGRQPTDGLGSVWCSLWVFKEAASLTTPTPNPSPQPSPFLFLGLGSSPAG